MRPFCGWIGWIVGGGGIVRRWRLILLGVAGVLAAAASTVLAIALNVATGGTARWFPTMERYPLWWTAGATLAVAGAGLLVWWTQRRYDQASAELKPAVRRLESWVVDRPAEVNQIVAALTRGGTTGITVAVQGAGGFGKTTIAEMVRADQRILNYFGGRVHRVTVGRDVRTQVLAGRVNGLLTQLEPDRAVTFTDAGQAGEYLAAVVAKGPRRLLILDDVWTEEQLAAFPVAGQCARLVTTRNPSLAAGTPVPVRVGQMSQAQALALLSAGLPPLSARVTRGLLEETERWPLLLRLVNKILLDQARLEPDITEAAAELLGRLQAGGALGVDELTEAAGQQLDVSDPAQRSMAVRATIQASTSLLSPAQRDRLGELAIFARNETIPVRLVTSLWQVTGGLDPIAARALCFRLDDLALLALVPGADGGAITMHDVIRDFLRGEDDKARLGQLHGILLEASSRSLHQVPRLSGIGVLTAWWELGSGDSYLWDHLIEHLLEAGRQDEAGAVAADLRWAGARLQRSGPADPAADLVRVDTPPAARLRAVLARTAHLLATTDPAKAVVDVLHSRVAYDPVWGPQVTALRNLLQMPRLVNRLPPPDLPDAALHQVLSGHTGAVNAVAIAADGSWLATAGDDGTVRTWDADTWQVRATLEGHAGAVNAVAIAADGSWLATAGDDGTVRTWDADTWQVRATLEGHAGAVNAVIIAAGGTRLISHGRDGLVQIRDAVTGHLVASIECDAGKGNRLAVASDGSWLATVGDGMVRTWDAFTGQPRAVVKGGDGHVWTVAIGPDGTWVFTGGLHGGSIWDAATGQHRVAVGEHHEAFSAAAVAPDGRWLATTTVDDRELAIWDAATGQRGATLVSSSFRVDKVGAVAICADGSWLAAAMADGTVRTWDAATGQRRAISKGHTGRVNAVAIAPDGSWLTTGGSDGTARIWDPAIRHTQQARPSFPGTFGFLGSYKADEYDAIWAMAVAPDGDWLATTRHSGSDSVVRIWDAATGQPRAVLRDHEDVVWAVAIAADSSWLATASSDGTVRTWDVATWRLRATLNCVGVMSSVAIAPDGRWLATSSYDGSVQTLDAATGQPWAATLKGHHDSVNAVAIAPDGSWLATASADRTAQIWDVASGRQRATLVGHDDAVLAVGIAPDGRWLATVSADRTARIWDVATGRQRATLVGHDDAVLAVGIAPDGRWLATVSADKTARIWDPATGHAHALMRVENPIRACSWLGAGAIYLGGLRGLYLFDFLTQTTQPPISH
jgi:WD40 repeat protein